MRAPRASRPRRPPRRCPPSTPSPRYFWVNIAGAFTEETYPTLSPIDLTFAGETTITLGSGETLSLIELDQPGVATNQTVVRIDDTGDLIVGDLVHANNHAWLAGGLVDGVSTPALDDWKAGLAQLPEIGDGTVYGGRGDFLPVDEAVAQQTAYLTKAEEIVVAYVEGLGDRRAELTDPATAQPHYGAIQAKLAEAFPDYAFPDLVGYSVYGLVNQQLAM